MNKKCVIFNYIPHKLKNKNKFNKWYNEYEYDLLNMFEIVKDILEFRHSEDEYNLNFEKFCFLIYNSSSTYIPSF